MLKTNSELEFLENYNLRLNIRIVGLPEQIVTDNTGKRVFEKN